MRKTFPRARRDGKRAPAKKRRNTFNIAKEFSLHYFFRLHSVLTSSASFFSSPAEPDEILRRKTVWIVSECESTSAGVVKESKVPSLSHFFCTSSAKAKKNPLQTSRNIKNEWMSLNVEIYFHLNLYFIFTSLWCKTLTMGQSRRPPQSSSCCV